MSRDIRPGVERFSKALALALYERELELAGAKITYFYDADVAFGTVMGLEHEFPRAQGSPDQLLVRALLSCGFLGEFHLLRPHALELTDQLQRQQQFRRKQQQVAFLQRARSYLRDKGILHIMAELDDIVTAELGEVYATEDDKVRAFLDILGRSPGETFAHIEFTYGTWWQRLRRYQSGGLLRLDKLGPEMRELLYTDGETVRRISGILRKGRERYSINVFNDAAALTALHKAVRSRTGDDAPDVVRFYTETDLLRQAIEVNATLRGLLSYDYLVCPGITVPMNGQLVLRDSHFFIMRTWFKELAPGPPPADSAALADLARLSEVLQSLLLSDTQAVQKAAAQITFEGKSLEELVTSFEKLTIMDRVWTSGGFPEALRRLEGLREWTAVFQFAERNQADELVFESIQDVLSELDGAVSRMRTWVRDFELVRAASQDIRHTQPVGIRDVMRDLGLVRWGYELNKDERQELLGAVNLLRVGGDCDLGVEVGKLASAMEEARERPRKCLTMCAVLWALRCFKEIVVLVQECRLKYEGKRKRLPRSLDMIQAAAEIRSSAPGSHDERRELVDRLWRLQRDLPKDRRRSILLGVAYVLYHAWRLEAIAGKRSVQQRDPLDEFGRVCAERSFQLGEEAFDLLPEGRLAWAFSINHCAYVGIVTGVQSEKTEYYFRKLVELETVEAFWNARFADTVGSYYLYQAERLWTETADSAKSQLDLAMQLAKAREYFEKAKMRDIGDMELDANVNRLNVLQDAWRTLMRRRDREDRP